MAGYVLFLRDGEARDSRRRQCSRGEVWPTSGEETRQEIERRRDKIRRQGEVAQVVGSGHKTHMLVPNAGEMTSKSDISYREGNQLLKHRSPKIDGLYALGIEGDPLEVGETGGERRSLQRRSIQRWSRRPFEKTGGSSLARYFAVRRAYQRE